eukprot:13750264-Ditylum_brightwellii.AAC.1
MYIQSIQHKSYTETESTADSGKVKTAVFHDKKYQGGKALPCLNHNFTGYHITERYNWEVNVQLVAKGATQLNSANDVGRKVKALIVKLYAAYEKDTINIFSGDKRQLKVKNFLKSAKKVKDLLDYSATDGRNKNATMITHVTGLIPFSQFKNCVFNWLKQN